MPAILMLALGACSGPDESAPSASQSPVATPVAAVEIHPRDLSRQLSISGTVEPRMSVRLAARTSGAVESVLVEEGQMVEQGAVLATLDMAEARAELARARAEENAAQLDYRRSSELRTRGVVSAAQHESVQVALQVAQSEHALWRTRVEFGRIVSPLNAVVAARHIEPGEAVQSQDTLFELVALDELVMRIGVSELDVVHMAPGLIVPIRLDALPDLALEGAVRRIFPVAQSGSRLVTVEVALPPDATALGVRPGFLARVRAVIDKREDVMAVPAQAIGVVREQSYVYVIEEGRLLRREVVTGVTRGQLTEIVSGLEFGEMVLASNPIEMREGQSVRIVSVRNNIHGH